MHYEFGHCEPAEMFELVDLANRVFRSGRPGDMGAEYPLVFGAENAENLRVARADGRMVAHVGICLRDASILGCPLRVASIGAVATDPEHRGNGIASQLMADARAQAAAQGAGLMLISGHRGLYRRLGYVEAGEFLEYSIPAAAAGADDGLYEVDEFRDDDLPAIVTLYQAEPVRFFRPLADWHKLLAASMLMNQPADLLVVRHGNAIVAYAGVQRPTPGAGGGEARVREIAGSRTALAGALPAIARRYGAETVDLITWRSDAEWRSQALQRGWTWKLVPFPGTLGIIDPARFFEDLRPVLEERGGEALRIEVRDGDIRFRAPGERLAVSSMSQLTALVFGGDTDESRAVPEMPMKVGAALNRLFPLPLLWYGYNYV